MAPVAVVPSVAIAAGAQIAPTPAFAVAAMLAEPVVAAPLPVADIPKILVSASAPALLGASGPSSPGDLTAMLVETAAGDAPLLDLIDRLPPSANAQHDQAVSRASAAPAALNLQACTMDELWLGDFELEDPRRASLVDQISNALKALFRSMTLRLGFGRHSMITYRGGRTPLPA
jgi:cell division protein FtsZ